MMLRRTLLLVLSLLFVACIVEAKVKDGTYLVPKASVAPVIDGVQDDIWKTLDWNFQRIYTVDGTAADSGTGLTGMSKVMWDDNNLYILFFSQDDDIEDNPAQTAGWQKDGVEIYIDGDNSKIPDNVSPDPGGGLAPGDAQMTIPHALMGAEVASAIGLPADVPLDGIEYKITEEDNVTGLGGWWLEVKLPLDNFNIIGAAGTKIGFELQQDESDGSSGQRESMSKWWSNSNNSWTDASLWGVAELTDRVASTEFEIKKVPAGTTIAIDGDLDAIYKEGNIMNQNLMRVDGAGNISNVMFDSYITSYLLWDDSNLYAFFDVIDDDIQDNPAQTAGWQKDGVEFYIDGDNSKIPDNVSPDPGGGLAPGDAQMTVPHSLMGAESAASVGLPADVPTDGIEFKIKEKDEGGWNLEMKLPLDNFNIVGAEGTKIGTEVQADESDADDGGQRGAMSKWWSPSNNSWTDASLWGTAYLGGVITVDVKEKPASAVKTFALDQNYPNPFNPTTKISFSIPQAGFTSVKVYNVLGQEVSTLLNKELKAGSFEVSFDASNLQSGVYFYKLQSGNTSVTKKMMLLK